MRPGLATVIVLCFVIAISSVLAGSGCDERLTVGSQAAFTASRRGLRALAGRSAASALSDCGRALTTSGHAPGMARSPKPPVPDLVAYHGEVWTDGRGYATVRLPAEAGPLESPLEYDLRDLEPSSSARVTAELEDGSFTIATAEPHVKVAWRISGRQPAGRSREQQPERRT